MSRMIRRRFAIATGVAAGIAGGAFAASISGRRGWAQIAYPAGKTVRIVVPFAAGGTTDILARVVAQILSESTGATFVIDNRTGGGGNVSAEIVAKAAPDGLTLLLGTVGTAVTNQYLYKDVPYDSELSFAPVALVGEVPNVLAVHPSFPAKTLACFVEHCKRSGSSVVRYASPGIGSNGHLAMEYLSSVAGIKLEHVVYRGRSRMIKDVVAGIVPVVMDNLPTHLRHIRSGSLRALGVSSSRRWFAAPEMPTIAEQGYVDFDAALWWYVAAPAGTRLELIDKLSDGIVKGIKTEDAIRRIRDAGAFERAGGAADLTRHMTAENRKWKKVIDAAKLQPQ